MNNVDDISPAVTIPPAPARGTLVPTARSLPLALSATPNPQLLLRALRRRWLPATLSAILGAIAMFLALYWLLPTPKYVARSLLRVPNSSSFLLATNEPRLQLQEHQRNQVALLRSRMVLKEALKERGLTDLRVLREQIDPVDWLERELQADFTLAPEVLRISLSGDYPEDLVTIVNAVREAYKREILDKERVERNERLKVVNELRVKYDRQLSARRSEQKDLEQKAGSKEPGARGMVQMYLQQQLAWNERELMQAKSDLRRWRTEISVAEAGRKSNIAPEVAEYQIEENLTKEPAILEAMASVRELQSLIESSMQVAKNGESDVTVIQLRRKLGEAEAKLAALRKRLRPGITADLQRLTKLELERSMKQAEARLASLTIDEKLLQEEVDRTRQRIEEARKNTVKLEDLREDSTNLENVAKRLAQEEEALKVELAAPERSRLLEEAVAIRPPETKKTLVFSIFGAFATLLATLASFALWEFRARRIANPDELTVGLGLRMVGTIPDARHARGKKDSHGNAILNEAVETTRTMILHALKSQSIRVVIITSAQSGEGKTSLATHLASSLAQVGYRTLLVDGDLRRPIVHRVFGIDALPGFCELLRKQSTLDEVIRPTTIERLSILPGGSWDKSASRMLAQDGMNEIMQELRGRFDFVLIDSSPVLPTVDPLLLGRFADVAILSVLSEVSRMPHVYTAQQRLTAAGIRVLGVVMSGVRGDTFEGYYHTRAPAKISS